MANIFLHIIFSICFGCSKNCLNETVLLSTHNICFCIEIRKLFICYALLTKGLIIVVLSERVVQCFISIMQKYALAVVRIYIQGHSKGKYGTFPFLSSCVNHITLTFLSK